MHHQLGDDQQRHRDEEADVNFDVHQERHGHAAAQQPSFHCREHQERQPGKQRDDDDSLAHHQQRIVGQVRPAQELEERPAQDEREVRRIPERGQTFRRYWREGIHWRSFHAGVKRTRWGAS